MADYTLINLERDVEDMAPQFGLSPNLETRFAREPLGLQNSGFSRIRIAPDFRTPFGHQHEQEEEVYLVIAGSARVKLDDEVVEMGEWDALRIAPGVMHCVEAGPDGADLIMVGAPNPRDVEMVPGWWSD